MRDQSAPDHAIAGVAGRQGGVVALGISRAAIHRRVAAGRLHALHRGVYAVGHRSLDANGRRWAAVLACRPDGVLSHHSAAMCWDITHSAATLIDVTTGRNGRKKHAGIRLHSTRQLQADERTTLAGLPITTPARTLLDLAATGLRGPPAGGGSRSRGTAPDRRLCRRALLDRYPARAGTPALNAIIEGGERDFCWPHARLVVEAYSYAWHRSPSALDNDRERDVALVLAGYRVLRFTWEQVTQRPEYVASAVLAALHSRAGANLWRLQRARR